MGSSNHSTTNGDFRQIKNLGEIPSDWDVAMLDSLTSLVTSGSRGWSKYMRGDGAFFVRSQNIGRGTLRWDDVAYVDPPNDQEADRAQIKLNDLLISVTGEPGNVALATESVRDGFVSQHVALVRLKDESLAPWAVVALSSDLGQSQFQSKMYGQTRPGLNLDNIGELLIPLPPEAERSLIRRTLGAIDDAIERTRAVIAQTRKLKTALLQDLLTNGLPGRHKKFHFVKRLGRLPKDWDTCRLNELTTESDDICYGVVQPGEEFRGGAPLVRVCNIEHGELDTRQLKRIDPAITASYKRSQLSGGELLVTLVGTIVPREAAGFNIARAVAKVTLKSDVNNRFVLHFLNTVANAALVGDAYESARKTLNLSDLTQFPIPVPDRQEQDDIVQLADSVGSRESAENELLQGLQATKAALSQALLTGRVRVPTTDNSPSP